MKKLRTVIICAALAILYVLPIFTLPGLGGIFVKYEGIEGESSGEDQADATGGTFLAHKNEIDVLAWSWGVSQATESAGGGGTSGGQCIDEVTFTKYIDKSSPDLMLHCFNGQQVSEATLSMTEADPTTPGTSYDYFTIKLINVVISSVANAGEADSPTRPVETFALNFTKIEWKYIENDAKGAATEYKWDLGTNQQYP